MRKRTQVAREEYAVIGLGRFGSALARRLEQLNHTVLGIDSRPELVQTLAPEITQAAILDATNEAALKAVDIAAFETVIVAIGDDFEACLLTTAALKNLGVKRVISKANNERQRDILLRVGADQVVQPEQDGGKRLADELGMPRILERLPLGPYHSLGEVVVPEWLAYQSLAQCDLRSEYQVTVLLVKRGDELIVSPPSDWVLQKEDVLLVLGENEAVTAFGSLS